MIRKIIPIAYFVLAALMSGCQGHDLSNPAVRMKNKSIESVRVNEESNAADTAKTPDKNSPTVIAYYFHRTMRCPGCLEIEAKAQQVIENSFANQITDEKLMWIPFNLDDPGGEEFEKEFDVSVSTLVLSRMTNENHIEYKKLEKVWDFIGDRVKFDTYIQNEVRRFMNE